MSVFLFVSECFLLEEKANGYLKISKYLFTVIIQVTCMALGKKITKDDHIWLLPAIPNVRSDATH